MTEKLISNVDPNQAGREAGFRALQAAGYAVSVDARGIIDISQIPANERARAAAMETFYGIPPVTIPGQQMSSTDEEVRHGDSN